MCRVFAGEQAFANSGGQVSKSPSGALEPAQLATCYSPEKANNSRGRKKLFDQGRSPGQAGPQGSRRVLSLASIITACLWRKDHALPWKLCSCIRAATDAMGTRGCGIEAQKTLIAKALFGVGSGLCHGPSALGTSSIIPWENREKELEHLTRAYKLTQTRLDGPRAASDVKEATTLFTDSMKKQGRVSSPVGESLS